MATFLADGPFLVNGHLPSKWSSSLQMVDFPANGHLPLYIVSSHRRSPPCPRPPGPPKFDLFNPGRPVRVCALRCHRNWHRPRDCWRRLWNWRYLCSWRWPRSRRRKSSLATSVRANRPTTRQHLRDAGRGGGLVYQQFTSRWVVFCRARICLLRKSDDGCHLRLGRRRFRVLKLRSDACGMS